MTTPEVPDSPLVALLSALGHRDVGAAEALCAPGCQLSTADGRRAQGRNAVRVLLDQFLSDLRSASYQLTAQWHQDGVWIAEALATYEMRDWLRLERLPRVFVVEAGADGIERGAGLRRQRAAAGATTGPPTSHSTLEAISSCPSEISSLAVPRATRRPTPIGEVVSSQPGHPPGRGRSREFPASGHTWRRVIASSGSTMTSGA